MKIFETILTETSTVRIRVRAETAEQAETIFNEFKKEDPGYLSDELDLNGNKDWTWKDFEEVHPEHWDEAATITKYSNKWYQAQYESDDEV